MTTATAARNVTALNDLDNAGPVLREWAVENADQLGYLSPEQRRSIAQQVQAGRAALDQIAEAVRV